MSIPLSIRQKIINSTTKNIITRRQSTLSDKELNYVTDQVHQLSDEFLRTKPLANIIQILTNIFEQDFKKQKQTKPEPTDIDVHELLKHELGDHPETVSTDLPPESKDQLDTKQSINTRILTIFGTNEPLKIQNIFNPRAMDKKAYVVLDRRYMSSYTNDLSLFQWDLDSQSQSQKSGSILGTTAPLRDITRMKMFPFKFPNCDSTIPVVNGLTVAIEELNIQSYSAIAYNRRFHFAFDMTRTGAINTSAPYDVKDVGNSVTDFEFYKPIIELEMISITFGSPFRRIVLDPDLLPATITPVGIQTVLTFSQPHLCAIGDIFYISDFNTTDPSADLIQIAQINSTLGWAASAITSTTVTIDVNLSTLVGAIVGSPFPVYLEAKRFIIRVEFTFRRYLE
jgi:hypothetical protein